jgi:23S rRNA pseudouridine2605 synthase
MSKGAFDKFMSNELKGAKKKEALKKEKRKLKAEARAIGEQKRREKWEKQRGINQTENEKFGKKDDRSKMTDDRKFGNKEDRNFSNNRKDFSRPAARKTEEQNDKWQMRDDKKFEKKEDRKQKTGDRSFAKPTAKNTKEHSEEQTTSTEKHFSKKYIRSNSDKYFKDKEEQAAGFKTKPSTEQMPLNKYIAHAGVCGRREAAEFVKKGIVTVNGDIIFEPGYKVSVSDEVKVKGKKLFLQKNLLYILLNKPKDFITTVTDPQGRKTVLDLIKGATDERVYPVGRLDRNTTGVLLLTNDGELAQKLTHPSFEIKKIYEAKLDKPLTKKDFEAILNGVTLEDGLVCADSLAYVDNKDKSLVGIEIHSGRNRIVRRIFEHLGYDVKNLDRVMFANLTKKNVDRSKWRMLNEKEVRLLKYMNQSFVKNKKEDKLKKGKDEA